VFFGVAPRLYRPNAQRKGAGVDLEGPKSAGGSTAIPIASKGLLVGIAQGRSIGRAVSVSVGVRQRICAFIQGL